MQADDDTDPDDRPTGSERKAIQDQRHLCRTIDGLPGAAFGSPARIAKPKTAWNCLKASLCLSNSRLRPFVLRVLCASVVIFVVVQL
jgi:hypothetical protein